MAAWFFSRPVDFRWDISTIWNCQQPLVAITMLHMVLRLIFSTLRSHLPPSYQAPWPACNAWTCLDLVYVLVVCVNRLCKRLTCLLASHSLYWQVCLMQIDACVCKASFENPLKHLRYDRYVSRSGLYRLHTWLITMCVGEYERITPSSLKSTLSLYSSTSVTTLAIRLWLTGQLFSAHTVCVFLCVHTFVSQCVCESQLRKCVLSRMTGTLVDFTHTCHINIRTNTLTPLLFLSVLSLDLSDVCFYLSVCLPAFSVEVKRHNVREDEPASPICYHFACLFSIFWLRG